MVLLLLCAVTPSLCSSLPPVCFRFLSFVSPKNCCFSFGFSSVAAGGKLLLGTLLGTRRNDGGAASNGGGRETTERDELLFFSPILLFFCSFLLFSRQLKSSPLCSSTLLSFSKIFAPPLFVSLPLFISRKRRSPPCSVPSWCRGEMGCLTCAG
jgi:hypothetical protein